MPQLDWFETWFGTSFYHTLYAKRSDEEAENFIQRLLAYLKPDQNSIMLDLACGAGRHARSLAQFGFDVTGMDLSATNIAQANKWANDHLRFYVQDMRHIGFVNHFDYVFNLFTSFGYFEDPYDNTLVARSIQKALKERGTFVFDYLNAAVAIQKLIPEEHIQRGTLSYHIKRNVENGFINKYISLTDEQGGQHHFREQVQIFSIEELKALFAKQHLSLTQCFGNYHLQPFDENHSERMILIFNK